MTPRGIRNKNPGNIERTAGTTWVGQAEQQADRRFVVFNDAKYGIRALAVVMLTYATSRKAADGSPIDTVREIITRWAPPSENNTEAYVREVAKGLGVQPDAAINVRQHRTMHDLVKAIIRHENGVQPYDAATIDAGLALAGIRAGK